MVLKFWVEYRGHRVELPQGPTPFGRSAACRIVLDDGMVSRHHGQFVVQGEVAMLEDLNSANGVYLNGERIQGSSSLKDGDGVRVGRQELVFRSLKIDVEETPPRSLETLHGQGVPSLAITRPRFPDADAETAEVEATTRTNALELLGGLADKQLALGRGDGAEKVLSGALRRVLDDARGGVVAGKNADSAARYAVRLAAATGKAEWVDYAIELFTAAERVLPGDVVDELFNVLRGVSGINLRRFREYLAFLQTRQASFGPAERFVVQRLAGLEKLAAAK